MENQSSNLVNLGDLASQLRLSAVWLKQEANAGRIPHLKAGKVLLFDIEAVRQALLEKARRGSYE